MRYLSLLLTFLFVGAIAVSACGNIGATPTSSLASIKLTTNPNPPTSGNIELVATITDANGQPLDEAEVFVFSSHTEMTSMAMNGKASAKGSGQYTLQTNFSMNGRWKITVQVKKPPLNITESFIVDFK